MDEVINELVLNNDYIKRIYLQLKASSEVQKIKDMAKQPDFLEKANSSLGIECPMCMVDITHSNISLLSCGHTFHKTCFRKYVEIKVTSKNFPIMCPTEECKKEVSTEDIQE